MVVGNEGVLQRLNNDRPPLIKLHPPPQSLPVFPSKPRACNHNRFHRR